MDKGVIAITIPIAGMLLAFGIIYMSVTAAHREKMAKIERGLIEEEHKREKFSLQRIFLYIFAPIGLLIGYLLEQNTRMEPVLAYISMGFLFAGIGQLIAYRLKKNDNPSDI